MEEYPDFHGDQPIDYVEKKHYESVGSSTLSVKFGNINTQIPIKRGCPNKGGQCFCPGTCNEIIGYRDRLPGEY